MKKIIPALIACVAVLYLASKIDDGPPTPTIDDVSKFVSTLKLGDNFYDISDRTAKATVTFQQLAGKIGPSEAEELLEKHLVSSTHSKQAQWNANLTDAYLGYFSPEELISIANERDNSPFAEKFEGARTKVGARMKNMSQGLLSENVTEALENALRDAEAN